MTAPRRWLLRVVLPAALLLALPPGTVLAQVVSSAPASARSAVAPAAAADATGRQRMAMSAPATSATHGMSSSSDGIAAKAAAPEAPGEAMKHGDMIMPASAGSAAMAHSHGAGMHATAPVHPLSAEPAPDATAAGTHGVAGMAGMPATEPMASSRHAGHGVDHTAMPGMGAHPMQAAPRAGQSSEAAGPMPGMSPAPDPHQHGMTMGAMQGGHAPPGARSPDYSDGVPASTMPGMHMRDNAALAMLLVDQLEAFAGHDAHGQSWDVQAWYGNDSNKLWLRSEGDRSGGKVEDAGAELLWSHAVASYWDTQLGLRHDFGDAPGRSWAAFGVQGLAPYWFDVEATAYVGTSGRTAARLRADYDVLFTQRLILQPELELNAYGRADPARRIGRGLSDGSLGLRLRYEVRRQFAPYIGVVWTRRFGATADFARADHRPVLDRQWVAGLRLWF